MIFIDWFLPGTASGGPVRSISNMIEHFQNRAMFFVVTRDHDYMTTKPYSNISYNQWNQVKLNLQVYYLKNNQVSFNKFSELIRTIQPTLIYINGIYSYKFSILPLVVSKRFKTPVTIGARGMLNPQAFTVKPVRKKLFLKLAKLLNLYKSVVFHATNEDEKHQISSCISNTSKIVVAPNLPRTMEKLNPSARLKNKGVARFVNIARISREKGTLKTIEVLKECAKGQVVLDIFGPVYDQQYWENCKKSLKHLPNNIQINYKGYIEGHRIPAILEDYHFFLMLSEGENFGHSILESLAQGAPVIIGDNTPWKGLRTKSAGWDLPVDNSDLICEAINQAISMSQLVYNEWSTAAFRLAQEFSQNKDLIQANEKLLRIEN